jgi:hypothetical protein
MLACAFALVCAGVWEQARKRARTRDRERDKNSGETRACIETAMLTRSSSTVSASSSFSPSKARIPHASSCCFSPPARSAATSRATSAPWRDARARNAGACRTSCSTAPAACSPVDPSPPAPGRGAAGVDGSDACLLFGRKSELDAGARGRPGRALRRAAAVVLERPATTFPRPSTKAPTCIPQVFIKRQHASEQQVLVEVFCFSSSGLVPGAAGAPGGAQTREVNELVEKRHVALKEDARGRARREEVVEHLSPRAPRVRLVRGEGRGVSD